MLLPESGKRIYTLKQRHTRVVSLQGECGHGHREDEGEEKDRNKTGEKEIGGGIQTSEMRNQEPTSSHQSPYLST